MYTARLIMRIWVAVILTTLQLIFSIRGSDAQATPQFSDESYTIFINETFLPDYPLPPSGFVVLSCSGSAVTYSIVSSSTNLPFSIDDMSGALSVTADLDYETTTSYQFEVECTSTNNAMSDRAAVNIQIQPVNEFRPVITSQSQLSAVINETSSSDTVIVTTTPGVGSLTQYSVSDQDEGSGNEIFFTLDVESDSGLISGNFRFNSTTGAIILINEIDFDATNVFQPVLRISYRITVCDFSPPLSDCPNVAVSVTVLQSNDNLPMFSANYYNVTYPESTPSNTTLITAPCTDDDFGITGVFRGIEIIQVIPNSIPNNTFSIDGMSGAITLVGSLDYETSRIYEIELLCTDNGNLEDRAVVVLQVEDNNDNAPIIDTPETDLFVTLSDSAQVGDIVSRFQCSDADSGVNADITYSISGNTNPLPFSINSLSGNIFVRADLTLPANKSSQNYTITLQCQDNGTISLVTSTILTIQVDKDVTTTSEPTSTSALPPLYVIIVPIVAGLLLILCFLILCCCCCYMCNKRRVDKQKKKLVEIEYVEDKSGPGLPKALIIPEYPKEGKEVPKKDSEYHLTFETTSFTDESKLSGSPSPTSSPDEKSPLSDTQQIQITIPGNDIAATTSSEQPVVESTTFKSVAEEDQLKVEDTQQQLTQESIDMVMSKV